MMEIMVGERGGSIFATDERFVFLLPLFSVPPAQSAILITA